MGVLNSPKKHQKSNSELRLSGWMLNASEMNSISDTSLPKLLLRSTNTSASNTCNFCPSVSKLKWSIHISTSLEKRSQITIILQKKFR